MTQLTQMKSSMLLQNLLKPNNFDLTSRPPIENFNQAPPKSI